MTKSIEDLDKEYAEKRAELLAREELLKQLPENAPEPWLIHFANRPRPWLSYKVKTLADAITILRCFGELEDVSARESGCLSIQPEGEHSKSYADKEARWTVHQAVEMRQHGGKGFYTASIEAYAVQPHVKVDIEVEQFPWKFRASMRVNYNRHGEVTTADFNEPPLLRGHWEQRVKFNGGSRDAFDLRYYFSGVDHIEDVARLAEGGANV